MVLWSKMKMVIFCTRYIGKLHRGSKSQKTLLVGLNVWSLKTVFSKRTQNSIVDACNGEPEKSNFHSIIAECLDAFLHLDEVHGTIYLQICKHNSSYVSSNFCFYTRFPWMERKYPWIHSWCIELWYDLRNESIFILEKNHI